MRRLVRSVSLALVLLTACGERESLEQEQRPTVRRDPLRPDSPNTTEPQPIFSPSETVERYSAPDASFVVHFSRQGPNAVAARDTNANGVPDYVESVAASYEEVATTYRASWNFRAPVSDEGVPDDHGGDGRFDVYLVDFGGRADGSFRRECQGADASTCPGYIVQENDFLGYRYSSTNEAVRILASHEFFHSVQAAYTVRAPTVLSEGTAVWATERFAPELDDLERSSVSYLKNPDRSLEQEVGGALDGFAYGAGLFFECLSTRNGDDTVRQVWSSLRESEPWLLTLDRVLSADGGTSLARELDECARWNLFTGTRARTGYGHRRAALLPEATTEAADAPMLVERSRIFGTSSRYFHVRALGADAAIWWKPAADGPDGGASWLRVRTAQVIDGELRFVDVPVGEVTALAASAEAFVLITHVQPQTASVPVQVCVGSREQLRTCSGVPVEEPPTETPEDPPSGCGCGAFPSSALLLLTPLLALARRRRRGGRGAALCVLGAVLFLGDNAWAQDAASGPARERSSDAGVSTPSDEGAPRSSDASEQGASPDAGAAASVGIRAPETAAAIPEITTIVTGSRLPQRLADAPVATEVLTRQQIRESGARDIAEALQARAGLEITSNVGSTALRMQGLGPEYNLILINGQRTVGRINGGVDLSRFSAEEIEQIEIVKGPASVLWGSEALAGTINIITRRPERPVGGSFVGSYGTLNQVDVEANGEASGPRWGVGVSAGYQRRDAYDYDLSTAATNGSSLDGLQAAANATVGARDGDGVRADFRVGYTRRVQLGVDDNGAGALIDRSARDNLLEGLATLRGPVGSGHYSLSASTAFFDRRFVLDQRGGTALDDVQDTQDWNVEIQSQVDQRWGDHTALLGVSFLNERLASPRLETGVGGRARFSAFAQDEWRPSKSPLFAIVGGARFDYDTWFGPVVTPRLATRWDPVSSLALRLSSGLGFRAPSFQELLLDFENPSAGYVINGNTALRPERSWGTNLNADWQATSRWTFSLGGFWNELWDMIGYASTNESEMLRFRYVNISRARSRGVEAQIRWKPMDGLSIDAGYTLTDARNLTEQQPIEGQSSHRGVLQVRYRFRPWGLTTSLRGSVTGPRPYLTDEGLTRSAPFFMLDARVAKTLGRFVELFVAGSNLLGAGNSIDLPIPPRSVFGGVSLRY